MIILYILLGIAFAVEIYIRTTRCLKSSAALDKLKGWAYAHRGLHGEGVPENSMAAFRAALEGGYGIELDVHLTRDGRLAVIHDSSLKRTAGADVRVEDLTSEELAGYTLEGTEERIPLLEQVLKLFNGKAPIILELKSAGDNYDELCEAVAKLMGEYEGAYCVESFDPWCVQWFKFNRPYTIRGQLTENFLRNKKSTLNFFAKWLMTWQMCNFLTRPDFVAYKFEDRDHFSIKIVRRRWGAQMVAWTLKTKEEYDLAVADGWIPIFEGFRP